MPTSVEVRHHRVPALDGVRGIAILLVLAVHTNPPLLAGGRIGVDLFFVLSGFLITSILLGEYRRRGTIHLGHFYLRRALRLLPALALVLLGVIGYAAAFDSAKFATTLSDAQAAILYYFNWRLVLQWPDLNLHQWMFSHLWSLSVEEQFYTVWPLLTLVALTMRAPLPMIFAVLASGIVLPALGRLLLWESSHHDLYFRTDLRFDGLMWGALVAWIMHAGYRPQNKLWGWIAAASFLGLLCIAWFELLASGYLYQGGFSLVGFASALLIAGAVWCPPQAPVRRILSFGPLCWVGQISYGLYLWHWPVFRALADYPLDPALKMLLEVGATLAIAAGSFYLVERHFLRLKDRLHESARTEPQVVSVAA
jgi:peptidoglycan/LPS O-acetylase OafA/YrhL